MARARNGKKAAALARAVGKPVHQVCVGLETALWEAGPNHVTEFADALQFEGKPVIPPEKKAKWEALGRFREELTKFLVGKDAAFIGGVAVRSYGGRTAATVDYDLLIAPELLKEVTRFLESQGGDLQGTVEHTYCFHIKGADLPMDVRVARSPLDQVALSTSKRASFEGRKLRLVRPAALGAMKVKAYSERKGRPQGRRDREDVRGLIEVGAAEEEEIRQLLEKHRPDLLPELDEILRREHP